MSAVTAPLTARQHEVLTVFTELTNRTGMPPTVRELGVALGLTSTNTVQGHLCNLARKGYLTHSPTSSHAFRALSGEAWQGSRMVATGGVWVAELGGFGEHEIHLFGSELAVGRWLMDLCVEVADYGVLAENWTWACKAYGEMPLPGGMVAVWEWRTVENEGAVDGLR